MHDPADDPPIVNPLNATHIGRQMRLNPPPLLIVQPKQIPPHDPDPLPKTNQDRIVGDRKLMSSDPRLSHSDWGKLKQVARSRLDTMPIRALYPDRRKLGFSTGWFGTNILKSPHYSWADIVHLHWISGGAFDVRSLRHCAKPVVWTMRDMWPMTGGCHYALDCDGYVSGCGHCPQLGSNFQRDVSKFGARTKRRSLPAIFQGVAISRWIRECALQSYVLGGLDIVVIPNCLDTEAFFPIDKAAARAVLGISGTAAVILIGHMSNSHYKGTDLLVDCFEVMRRKNINVRVLSVGHDDRLALAYPIERLGLLGDVISLRVAYSAADVFVTASRAEAFGKMLIEAMACGTPVVAFDAGGPRDIVVHTETGYLADPFKGERLADGVAWTLAEKERHRLLGMKSRQRVE
jgi:glycosyltransferase involved in cell wall biosynthesis